MQFERQTNVPLYPKILWNRPVNRQAAGRLLIVGGHTRDFSVVQAAYQHALAAGIGECSVALPVSLRPLLAGAPDTHFVTSTSSGSLAKRALNEILALAESATAMLIGPNLSGSSDSWMLLDGLLERLSIPVIVAGEGLAAIKINPELATKRPKTLLVGEMPELFQLASKQGQPISLKPGMDALNRLQILSDLAAAGSADYLLAGRLMIAASDGQLSLTSAVSAMDFFFPATVAVASVFWLQQAGRGYEALTTASYILAETRAKLLSRDEAVLTHSEIDAAIKTIISQH